MADNPVREGGRRNRDAARRRLRDLAFDRMNQGVVVFDRDGLLLDANLAAERILGLALMPHIGRRLPGGGPTLVDEAGILLPERRRPATRALVEGRPVDGAILGVASPGGGVLRWIRSDAIPVFEEGDERPVEAIETVSDITELRLAELAARSALGAKDLLLKEVYHRVKNNLATVASLLSLQSGAFEDAVVRAAFEESRDRVEAMALVHEELYQSERLSCLDFASFAERLVGRLVRGANRRPALELALEPLELPLAAAVPLGLVLNELVTNSLKYAFPEGGGRLRVSLGRDRDEPRLARLEVADDGPGMPEGFDPARATSLGLILVRELSRQAGGEARCGRGEGGGATCVVRFPAPPDCDDSGPARD